jgi:hypothetical protein
VIKNGISNGYPQSYENKNDELRMFKNGSSLIPMSNDKTCFSSSSDISVSGSTLEIKPNTLPFKQNTKYEFTIETTYLGVVYRQTLKINILDSLKVPVVNIKCKFPSSCFTTADYERVNPTTNLSLVSQCTDGCINVQSIYYKYIIYKEWDFALDKWIHITNLSDTLASGTHATEMTIFKRFFEVVKDADIFKIEFEATVYKTSSNSNATGSSILILKKNKSPYGGNCSISSYNGITITTVFTVTCQGWLDDDGRVALYSFSSNVSFLYFFSFSFSFSFSNFKLIFVIYSEISRWYKC